MKKACKWIIIVILSIIFLLEITLRLTSEKKVRRWSDFKYQPDTLLGYRYLPNSKGIFQNIAIHNNYYFNSLGFPGKEFSQNKMKEIFRIILVGASNEIGFNTDGPLNYINLVNSYFKNNKINAEIINCSIDGSGKELRKLKFIKNECLEYQPDLILFSGKFPFEERFRYRTTYKNIRIEYEHNTVNIDSVKNLIDKKIDQKCFMLYLFDFSYIFRYICKYYFDNKNTKDFKMPILKKFLKKNEKVLMGYARGRIFWSVPKPNEKKKPKVETKYYTLEESLTMLKNISSYLSDKGIKFVFFDKYKIQGSDTLNLELSFPKYGVNYLPLNAPYKTEYSFGEDDGHLSQEGHKEIAKSLYKALIENFIPKKNRKSVYRYF